ncbi:hypothetical protein A2U01_0113032, partial [Trifolium medium]|nr:hypothetical protein [Trifolium medium]
MLLIICGLEVARRTGVLARCADSDGRHHSSWLEVARRARVQGA